MLQLRSVNRELKKIDPLLELEKGEGYFYFIYDDGAKLYETSSVMVNSLNQLTMEQWLDSARSFVGELKTKGKIKMQAWTKPDAKEIATLMVDAFTKMAHPTAESMARTAYAVLVLYARKCALTDERVRLFAAGEQRPKGSRNSWHVGWVDGGYEWAVPVSIELSGLMKRTIETNDGYDLCFFPIEDRKLPHIPNSDTDMTPEAAIAVLDRFEFFMDGSIRCYPSEAVFDKAVATLKAFVGERRN